MATLWSIGKRSALYGVRLFSRLLIKSIDIKHEEPLALFAPEEIDSDSKLSNFNHASES